MCLHCFVNVTVTFFLALFLLVVLVRSVLAGIVVIVVRYDLVVLVDS